MGAAARLPTPKGRPLEWSVGVFVLRLGDPVRESTAVFPTDVVHRVRGEGGFVGSHPTVVEQLFQARAQQLPIMEVRFSAVSAVHDDSADAARLEKRLVDGEIGQVRNQFGSFLIAERWAEFRIVITESGTGIVRVTRERVWGQRIVRHMAHGTGFVQCGGSMGRNLGAFRLRNWGYPGTGRKHRPDVDIMVASLFPLRRRRRRPWCQRFDS